jgi:hypothetical protein
MRVNDGSWHYAALTYGDDTAELAYLTEK